MIEEKGNIGVGKGQDGLERYREWSCQWTDAFLDASMITRLIYREILFCFGMIYHLPPFPFFDSHQILPFYRVPSKIYIIFFSFSTSFVLNFNIIRGNEEQKINFKLSLHLLISNVSSYTINFSLAIVRAYFNFRLYLYKWLSGACIWCVFFLNFNIISLSFLLLLFKHNQRNYFTNIYKSSVRPNGNTLRQRI